MTEPAAIPVIDLFAGPGGLGEGFSAFLPRRHGFRFRVALSVEMEPWAHQTLELRSFFHQFAAKSVPDGYYAHLRGEISRDELFDAYRLPAADAQKRAWKAELGIVDDAKVDRKIRWALGSAQKWVLCGGPPCQAFSVVGRSRNGGIADDDHRVYLYRQYLRILSVHEPPVFIMENVKGLLSSQVNGSDIFEKMLNDLKHPAGVTAGRQSSTARYKLFPIVGPAKSRTDVPRRPADFVVKCEDYGIPQCRHRVIILGIREDLAGGEIPVLKPHPAQISASRVLKGLPPVRSGLTRREDSSAEWQDALLEIANSDFIHSRRNGSEARLRDRVIEALSRMHDFRADRGAEFIACTPSVGYRPSWFLDSGLGGVCNHATRPHMPSDLHRYLYAACYARVHRRSPELKDFPTSLHPEHSNLDDALKKGLFDDRFRVQLANRPATTITSHIAKDGHYFIHYDEAQCRSLTVREAARLQTFPDNYFFCGPRTHQYRQVGNAVPPLVACEIAGLVSQVFQNGVEASADLRVNREVQPTVRYA